MANTMEESAIGLPLPRAALSARQRRSIPLAIGALLLLVAINLVFLFAPINYRAFGMLAYPGVFLIAFLGNATTFVPVPYIPVVAHVANTAQLVWLVVLLAALGSVLGESVAFGVGRAEERLVENHRWFTQLRSMFARPVRAGVFLFFFAAPLNPLFDVAGLAAGAFGVPYRVFFASVFLGRIVRFALIAWFGITLGFGD